MADIVALLAERREEIKAMAKLVNEMASTIGEDAAERVLCEAIAAEARAAGRKAAPMDPEKASPAHFVQVLKERGDDGGMSGLKVEIEGDALTIGVERCDICPLYSSSSLPRSIAHALSCGREAPFAEGYDHRLRLLTIEGATERNRACRMKFAWDESALARTETRKTTLTVTN